MLSAIKAVIAVNDGGEEKGVKRRERKLREKEDQDTRLCRLNDQLLRDDVDGLDSRLGSWAWLDGQFSVALRLFGMSKEKQEIAALCSASRTG